MDRVFDACVWMLLDLAAATGLTYKEVNVIIFCVVWPAATVWLVWQNIALRQRLRTLGTK